MVDTLGPVVSGIAVNPDPTNIDPTVTFTATDTANQVALVEYYIDTYPDASPVWSSAVSPLVTTTNVTTTISIITLEEGEHIVFARAKDNIGNWGDPQQTRFMVDKTGVRVVLYEVLPDPISSAMITLTGYADDYTVEVEKLQYQVIPDEIGGTVIDWTDIPESAISRDVLKTDFSYELPVALMDGSYTAQVRAYDSAGNVGLDEDSFTVDSTEPNLTIEVLPLPSSGLAGDVSERTVYVKGVASDATTGVDFIRFTVRDSQGGVQYVTWSGGEFDLRIRASVNR